MIGEGSLHQLAQDVAHHDVRFLNEAGDGRRSAEHDLRRLGQL